MAALSDLAADMANQARRTGAATRDLSRGLRLELAWCAGQKILTLSRPAVPPSEEEIAICQRAFGVPPQASRRDGGNQVELRWHVDSESRLAPAPATQQPGHTVPGQLPLDWPEEP